MESWEEATSGGKIPSRSESLLSKQIRSCDLCGNKLRLPGSYSVCQDCDNVLCGTCKWMKTKIEYMQNDDWKPGHGACHTCEILLKRGNLRTSDATNNKTEDGHYSAKAIDPIHPGPCLKLSAIRLPQASEQSPTPKNNDDALLVDDASKAKSEGEISIDKKESKYLTQILKTGQEDFSNFFTSNLETRKSPVRVESDESDEHTDEYVNALPSGRPNDDWQHKGFNPNITRNVPVDPTCSANDSDLLGKDNDSTEDTKKVEPLLEEFVKCPQNTDLNDEENINNISGVWEQTKRCEKNQNIGTPPSLSCSPERPSTKNKASPRTGSWSNSHRLKNLDVGDNIFCEPPELSCALQPSTHCLGKAEEITNKRETASQSTLVPSSEQNTDPKNSDLNINLLRRKPDVDFDNDLRATTVDFSNTNLDHSSNNDVNGRITDDLPMTKKEVFCNDQPGVKRDSIGEDDQHVPVNGGESQPLSTDSVQSPTIKSSHPETKVIPNIQRDGFSAIHTSDETNIKCFSDPKLTSSSDVLVCRFDDVKKSSSLSRDSNMLKNNVDNGEKISALEPIEVSSSPTFDNSTTSTATTNVNTNSNSSNIDQPPNRPVSKDAIPITDIAKHKRKRTKKISKHICAGCGRRDCNGPLMKAMRELSATAAKYEFEIHNVVPDGNCMYSAVVDQLEMEGDNSYSAIRLRQSAVDYLRENPRSKDGTHYMMFMDNEDWENYLCRMSQEGQWGDHLILQAISEVIKRNIEVLNGSDAHKLTSISSDLAPADSRILNLGHVGELHYVSLRPMTHKADEEAGLDDGHSDEDETNSINIPDQPDTVTAMFSEDYIEPYSQIPALHLSYLVTNFLPLKSMMDTASEAAEIANNMEYGPLSGRKQDEFPSASQQSIYQIKTVGDVADKLYVPFLEERERTAYDTGAEWYDVDALDISSSFLALPKGHGIKESQDVSLETDRVHPGYARLISDFPDEWGSKTNEGSKKCFYLPRKSYLFQSDTSTETKDKRASETSYAYSIFGSKKFAISCPIWPEVASEWKTRDRNINWPGKSLVDSVVADGCHLLAYPHPHSSDPSTEFSFCFSVAERRLAEEALTQHQRRCFIVFKSLCSQEWKGLKPINSTHLKSIFFYACETLPSECWETRVGGCLFYLIDRLISCLQNRKIECYFIKNNNMIDHLSQEEIRMLMEKTQNLRIDLLKHLMSMTHYYGLENAIELLDRVRPDMEVFRSTKNIRNSVLTCFVPAKIHQAKLDIDWRYFKKALVKIQEAYEERLTVSTCEDTVQFTDFLSEATGATVNNRHWWFFFYVDESLGTTLSSDLSMKMNPVTMNEIIGDGIAPEYSFTLVPGTIASTPSLFCIDFAWFLFNKYKTTQAMQVLKVCISINSQLMQFDGLQSQNQGKYVDLTDIFTVYLLLYYGYVRQQQVSGFSEFVPEMTDICERLQTKESQFQLSVVLKSLGNTTDSDNALRRSKTLPVGNFDVTVLYLEGML